VHERMNWKCPAMASKAKCGDIRVGIQQAVTYPFTKTPCDDCIAFKQNKKVYLSKLREKLLPGMCIVCGEEPLNPDIYPRSKMCWDCGQEKAAITRTKLKGKSWGNHFRWRQTK